MESYENNFVLIEIKDLIKFRNLTFQKQDPLLRMKYNLKMMRGHIIFIALLSFYPSKSFHKV